MINYCSHNYSEDIFHDYAVFRDRTAASSSSSSSSNRSVSKSDAGDDGDGTSSGKGPAGGGGGAGGRGRSASKKGGRGKGRGGGRGKGSKKGTGEHSDEMDDVTDTQDGAPDQNPGVSVAEGNDTSAATLTAMDCSDVDPTTQGEVSEEQKGASTIQLKSLQESSVEVDGIVKIGDSRQTNTPADGGESGVIIDEVIRGQGDVVHSMTEDTMTEVKTEGRANGVTENTSAALNLQNPQGELSASLPMSMSIAVVDPCTASLSLLDVKLEVDGQGQGQGQGDRETGDCEQDRKRRRVGFVEPLSVDTHTVPFREERGREAKMKNNGKSAQALQVQRAEEISCINEEVVEEDAEEEEEEDRMVQCNECFRWVHALCEGIDQSQYEAMTRGTHPVWVRNSNIAPTSFL